MTGTADETPGTADETPGTGQNLTTTTTGEQPSEHEGEHGGAHGGQHGADKAAPGAAPDVEGADYEGEHEAELAAAPADELKGEGSPVGSTTAPKAGDPKGPKSEDPKGPKPPAGGPAPGPAPGPVAPLPDAPDHAHDFGCGKTLDAWGVTRQFSFGQFVTLYANDGTVGHAESVPLVVTPDGALNREVTLTKDEHLAGTTQPGAAAAQGKAVQVSAADLVARATGPNKAGRPPAGSVADELGGLPLDLALSADNPIALVTQPPPVTIEIADLSDVLENKTLDTDGGAVRPLLDDATKIALLEGRTVDTLAEYTDDDGGDGGAGGGGGGGARGGRGGADRGADHRGDTGDDTGDGQPAAAPARRTMIRLQPVITTIDLDAAAVDTALATGTIALTDDDQELTLDRSPRLDTALRSGSSVDLTAKLADGKLRRFHVTAAPLPTSKPLAKTFTIEDPSDFLRAPYLPAVDGTPLRVTVDNALVTKLRTDRAATFPLNGTDVTLQVVAAADPAAPATPAAEVAFTPERATSLGAAGLFISLTNPPPGAAGTDISGLSSSIGGGIGGGGIPYDPRGPRLPYDPRLPGGGIDPGTNLPNNPSGPVINPGDGGLGGTPIGLTPDPDGGFSPTIGWPGIISPLEKIKLLHSYPFWAKEAQRVDGTKPAGTPDDLTGEKIHGPVKGLPVALFLPWKQEWRFRGLSRGNLLSSIALAPREERVIRMYSWERRSKALEQSTETETDMQQDYTSTTRDTDDVLREMTSNQKFNSQIGADFEASYSPGVASIKVGLEANMANEFGLQQVTKSSTQHLTETVHRASARVRTRRITKITESTESVSGEDVVRRIVNHNECRTMTLDYFEQLAHYTITTRFERERLRVVVMIDNPMRTTAFTNMTLRTNETALRQALLNPELGDAFAAARLLASYENAWKEAARVAEESKKVSELNKERVKETNPNPPVTKAGNPFEAQVLKAAKDVQAAAAKMRGAQIDPALVMIAVHIKPMPTMISNGQYWLWSTLVGAKLGAGATEAIAAIAATTTPTIDDARRLADTFGSGRAQELSRLASLPDNEKEELALAGAIRRRQAHAWDWAWWSGSCRDNGLYTPNDAGLVGALTRMLDALTKYEGKQSEGDALQQQQQMVQQAQQEQAAANWVDKLEMKYGLDVVADAQERQAALLTHLEEHKDYYHYVLFQALPPGEQLKLLTANAAELRVGFFEPRVVAYNGSQLAIPLTPTGQNALTKFVQDAQDVLGKAADEAQAAADQMVPEEVIIPTAGLVVETSLGKCTACEPHRELMHTLEARSATALARQAEAEATRREKLLGSQPPRLDEFADDDGGRLTIRLEHVGAVPRLAAGPAAALVPAGADAGGDRGEPPPV